MLKKLFSKKGIAVNEAMLKREIALLTVIEHSTENVSDHLYRIFYLCKHMLEVAKKHDRFDEELDKDLEPMLNSVIYHDIGKGVLYTRGENDAKYTVEDRTLMEQHVETGVELLDASFPFREENEQEEEFKYYCKRVIAGHHEKYDGTGYPLGLKGDQIPLIARIMCLLDIFGAIMENRPYNPATPLVDTLEYIKEQSGKSFDPTLVELFIGSIDEIKVILKKHPYK